jgi:hypothetical protein
VSGTLPFGREPTDKRKVSDNDPAPMWWPSEQAAAPRRRRSGDRNEAAAVDVDEWQPRARSRKAANGGADIFDATVLDVQTQNYASPPGWLNPVGWVEPTARSQPVSAVIETNVTGAPTARPHDFGPMTAPRMSDLPAVRTSTDIERFDISRALHVDEDHTIDPLAPIVTVVNRFAWKKLARNVAIVLAASIVIVVGFTVVNSRGSSSRVLAVKSAAARALESEILTGQLRYVTDQGVYVGTVDAQRDPVLQHFTVTGEPNAKRIASSTFESIWIRGDLFVRSAQSAAGLGDKWVVVHRGAAGDMRARIDMSAVLAISTPEPLLPLRVIAKNAASAKEAGRETIDGVATTHYVVVIDTNKIRSIDTLDDVRLTLKQYGWIGETKLDVWIDGAGQLVKMDVPVPNNGRLTVALASSTGKLSVAVPPDAADASALPEFVAVLDGATS